MPKHLYPSLYYKLGPGVESQFTFKSICNQVLSRVADIDQWQFNILMGSSSVDSIGINYLHLEETTGWKYELCGSPLSDNQKFKIKESFLRIKSDIKKFYSFNRLIFWTAEDLNERDLVWLYDIAYLINEVSFLVWGSKEIEELFFKFPDIGSIYYQEDFPSTFLIQEKLSNQISNLITPPGFKNNLSYNDALINPSKYLDFLKRQLAILNDEGLSSEGILFLKSEIKSFCVSSEVYFTMQAADSRNDLNYFYSCSSLIDRGLDSYLADDGWIFLLKMMGQVARSSEGKFMRVFFIKPLEITNIIQIQSLAKIVRLHLRYNVSVSLFSHDDLSEDLFIRRNMAIMGGKSILYATDQIQWDLGLSSSPEDIERGNYQHSYFRKNALYIFYPNEFAEIDNILHALFKKTIKIVDQDFSADDIVGNSILDKSRSIDMNFLLMPNISNGASSIIIYNNNINISGGTMHMTNNPGSSSGDVYNAEQVAAMGKNAHADNTIFINSKQQQTLAESAAEIQHLLKQLERTNPNVTEIEKVEYVNDETTPSFKRRFVNALKASGEAALDEFILENKYLKVVKAAAKGWLELND
jgi:hypothetical protein